MDFKMKIFWLLIAPCFLCGFRTFGNQNPWSISAQSVTDSKLFVIYPYANRVLNNDLPAGDPLSGPATVTVQQLMDSIFADYNSIQGAYVTLVDASDADYSTNAFERTIKIEQSGPSGALAAGGEAQPHMRSSQIIGCSIYMKDNTYESAKGFLRLVTHEMGHCLGLLHPMDTTHAIMSYYSSGDVYRLQIDDKMAIIYLYPVDPARAREDSTLGLACSRR
jgi:hypothetical protein